MLSVKARPHPEARKRGRTASHIDGAHTGQHDKPKDYRRVTCDVVIVAETGARSPKASNPRSRTRSIKFCTPSRAWRFRNIENGESHGREMSAPLCCRARDNLALAQTVSRQRVRARSCLSALLPSTLSRSRLPRLCFGAPAQSSSQTPEPQNKLACTLALPRLFS